ncbi:MAG: hypothetical protein HOD60_00045 [Candidatus Nitrosopelagicus sp.]|jgi:ribosomal protein L31|nr:hypothetical protein [Candidatus Nitrosopelagicus sp.]
MDMIVDTLPVLVYDEVVKVGLVRKDIEDGVFEKTETPIQSMMNNHQIESDERIEQIHNPDEPPRQSANLESLYELVQIITMDMQFAMHPQFTGKIRQDNRIEQRLEKYYKISIKKYAKQLKIYIDGLIKYDNYPAKLFDDYERLEMVIRNTDDEVADEFLLKLLTIVRQMIPPNFHQINTFVIDSNAVDPNKVE